jgi:hypothetical protein
MGRDTANALQALDGRRICPPPFARSRLALPKIAFRLHVELEAGILNFGQGSVNKNPKNPRIVAHAGVLQFGDFRHAYDPASRRIVPLPEMQFRAVGDPERELEMSSRARGPS